MKAKNMAEVDAIFHYITWVFHHFVFPLKFKFSNELTSFKIKVKIDEKVLPFFYINLKLGKGIKYWLIEK